MELKLAKKLMLTVGVEDVELNKNINEGNLKGLVIEGKRIRDEFNILSTYKLKSIEIEKERYGEIIITLRYEGIRKSFGDNPKVEVIFTKNGELKEINYL